MKKKIIKYGIRVIAVIICFAVIVTVVKSVQNKSQQFGTKDTVKYTEGLEELSLSENAVLENENLALYVDENYCIRLLDKKTGKVWNSSIPEEMRAKIGMFCNMPKDCVFENQNARSLYEVPLLLHAEHLDDKVLELLRIDAPEADLAEWRAMVERQLGCKEKVNIALVGKYVELPDAYLSVVEALEHGGIFHGVKAHILWIAAETVTDENAAELLKDADGLVVPGGFGSRGLEGKMAAIRYARENGLPFLGLCLGMQMAVIEFARHKLGLPMANTTEMDPDTPDPVIGLMEDQNLENLGHTMRLGKYRCELTPGTVSAKAYGETEIWERHRHRYEFNNDYRERFEKAGMVVAGRNPERDLVEIVELPDHPFFVAVQYHPEFKSRPNRPHPLFRELIGAAMKHQKEHNA